MEQGREEEEWLLRQKMVQQIAARGIVEPYVIESMRQVPRHLFIPLSQRAQAYEDHPIPIAAGQTVSQPFIIARMCEAANLGSNSKVLEIGTGSGYSAAVLAHIASHVYTVERLPQLAKEAQARLSALGYSNITVKQADGTLGLLEFAPYDAIIVTAAAPAIPHALLDQLAPNGTLIIPIGDTTSQMLVRMRKQLDGTMSHEALEAVRFVPLIGQEGWKGEE